MSNVRDDARPEARSAFPRRCRSRGYTPLVEPTSVDLFGGDRREINSFETANIDTPYILRRARTPKWKNAAARAKIILRNLRVPLIQG